MKVRNIQQVRMNGRKMTAFDIYREHKKNSWIFSSREYIDGWFKRPVTLLKKLEQEQF